MTQKTDSFPELYRLEHESLSMAERCRLMTRCREKVEAFEAYLGKLKNECFFFGCVVPISAFAVEGATRFSNEVIMTIIPGRGEDFTEAMNDWNFIYPNRILKQVKDNKVTLNVFSPLIQTDCELKLDLSTRDYDTDPKYTHVWLNWYKDFVDLAEYSSGFEGVCVTITQGPSEPILRLEHIERPYIS